MLINECHKLSTDCVYASSIDIFKMMIIIILKRQLYAQGNALARRFHMCSDNVKVTIFRSYCSSLYTSQLWWKYKVNSIRKLYVAYNNAFRMLFMLPRDCSASGMFAVHNVYL